jgi:hypothetical protein
MPADVHATKEDNQGHRNSYPLIGKAEKQCVSRVPIVDRTYSARQFSTRLLDAVHRAPDVAKLHTTPKPRQNLGDFGRLQRRAGGGASARLRDLTPALLEYGSDSVVPPSIRPT